MEKRVIATEVLTEDHASENTLRPTRLAEYIGQQRVKDTLTV